jgi:uncharacterized coiled-coil protein SlyX
MTDASTVVASPWLTSMPALIGMASGVVTSLIGLISGFGIEWFRDGRTYRREREARDSERRVVQLEQRKAFQRATLLSLQEELSKFNLGATIMHLERVLSSQKLGEWKEASHSSKSADEVIAADTQVTILVVRVNDETVRGLVEKYRGQKYNVGLAPTKDDAERSEGESRLSFYLANKRIGEVLRELESI